MRLLGLIPTFCIPVSKDLYIPMISLGRRIVGINTGCEGYWRPIFKIVSCISH